MSSRCPAAPFSPEFLLDPHPTYEHLRAGEPVCPVAMPTGERVWLVTRYTDVRKGMSDPRLSNDPTKRALAGPYANAPAGVEAAFIADMLNVDPPTHSRLRGLVADSFTPKRAEQFRDHLAGICDDLLHGLADREVIDVVADFAEPFTAQASGDLLGVPREFRARYRTWTKQIAAALLRKHDDDLMRPSVDLLDFVHRLIATKRTEPAEDLLTALITACDEGQLGQEELTSMTHLLLIAGQEGPANLIGTGIYLLLTNPEQLDRLRVRPDLLPGAVDEFLRFEAPLGLAIYRHADVPVTYSDVTIPAGEPIAFSLLSAGRDQDQFSDPNRLDIGRGEGNHLAFGWGRHYCLGAPLGRIEGQVAIGSLLSRFPNLRLVANEGVAWQPSVITRSLSALHVKLR